MSDVILSIENLSKRYCKSLKRSLWYGLIDLAGEISLNKLHREPTIVTKESYKEIRNSLHPYPKMIMDLAMKHFK